MAKFNRFGYMMSQLGYPKLSDVVKKHGINIPYETFYSWCTKKCSPYDKYSLAIDQFAGILCVSRQQVLNAIATNPTFEVDLKKNEKNEFKKRRELLGMSQAEFADYLGLDNKQILVDLENGKRASLPNSEILTVYLQSLDLSFTQFQNIVKELTDVRKDRDKAKREEKKLQEEKPVTPEVIETQDVVEEVQEECKDHLIEIDYNKACEEAFATQRVSFDADKVMSLIYGQVDYETYRAVENILRG